MTTTSWFDELCGSTFMPHGQCYLWDTSLLRLHGISDSLIALAYFSIPLVLLYFVRKRRDLPYQGIFLLFGTFIIACGTTHLMEVVTLWHPYYWISGLIKALTATVSLITAVALAKEPVTMALAMAEACRAGRRAALAGRIPNRLYGSASSPIEGHFVDSARRG